MNNLDALLKLIAERLDPDEFIDVLGYSTEHLCNIMRQEVLANKGKFEEFLDIYDPDQYTDYVFEGEDDA